MSVLRLCISIPHCLASASKAGIAVPCIPAHLSTSADNPEAHQIAPHVCTITKIIAPKNLASIFIYTPSFESSSEGCLAGRLFASVANKESLAVINIQDTPRLGLAKRTVDDGLFLFSVIIIAKGSG